MFSLLNSPVAPKPDFSQHALIATVPSGNLFWCNRHLQSTEIKQCFAVSESCFLFGSYLWFKSIPPALPIACNQISLSAITMSCFGHIVKLSFPGPASWELIPLLLKRWEAFAWLPKKLTFSDCRHMLKMTGGNIWMFGWCSVALVPPQVGLFHFSIP